MKQLAKKLTLFSKLIAIVFVISSYIIISLVLKKPLTSDIVDGIIKIGFFIFMIFAPIDMSKLIEKFTGVKK